MATVQKIDYGGLPTPMQVEVVAVTPELAQEWLVHNVKNRNYRVRNARTYARDMKTGKWRWTGDPIAFDEEGRLINGQHRLNAVVISGVTVPFAVVRGLPPEAQEVMDLQAQRTVADALKLRGGANNKTLAAVGRRIWEWTSEAPNWAWSSHSDRPSNAEVIELVADDPVVAESVIYAHRVRNFVPARPSVIAFAHWLFRTIDVDCWASFFHDLEEQSDLQKNDPVLTLLRRLREEASKSYGNRHGIQMDVEAQFALFVQAWNARREGRQLERMLIRQDREYPLPR